MANQIRQLLSQTSYVADGVTTVWNFSFAGGYIDKAHVKAQFLDANSVTTQIVVTLGMFLGEYQLSIVPAIPAGLELTIYRDTPKDLPLVDFADKAALTEASLDLNAKQAIFVAAESADLLNTTVESTSEINQKLATVLAAATHVDAVEDRFGDIEAYKSTIEANLAAVVTLKDATAASQAAASGSATAAGAASGAAAGSAAAADASKNAALATAHIRASTDAAEADATILVGDGYLTALPSGALQAYIKTSGASSTALGSPFMTSAILNARLDAVGDLLPIDANLFDKRRATDSRLVKATNGTLAAFSGWFATDRIKITPGGTFILNRAIYGDGSTYGIAYFDITGTFLSGVFGVTPALTVITAPATAAYVQFAVQALANKAGMFMAHGSTIPANYKDYDYTDAYTQRANISARLSELIRPVPNLFKPESVTLNTVVSSTTGTASAATNFFATGYMPVVPGTIRCDTTAESLGETNGWAFYDSSLVFISGSAGPVTANADVTVPFGAAYARASMHNFPTGNLRVRYSMQIYQGTVSPTVFQSAGYTDSAAVMRIAQDAIRSYGPASIDLFDKGAVTTAAALPITGIVDATAAYASYCYSGYIPVRPGVQIAANLRLSFGTLLGWVWYDRDKNYLSGTVGGTYVAGTGVTPPPAAAFMRFSCLVGQIVRLKITEGAVAPPTDTFGWSDLRARYRWLNKVLSVCGDSIMDTVDGTDVWHLSLLYQLKMTLANNYGTSGHRMYQMLSGSRTVVDFATTDLAVLAYGTNDYYVPGFGAAPPTPIGSISDIAATGSTASFIAATKYNIEALQGAYPAMRVVFIAPMQRFPGAYGAAGTTPNILGFTLLDYVNAIKAVAALYSCPVLDQYNELGINSLTQTYFLGDGLHPNQLGYTERVIPLSVAFLERC